MILFAHPQVSPSSGAAEFPSLVPTAMLLPDDSPLQFVAPGNLSGGLCCFEKAKEPAQIR